MYLQVTMFYKIVFYDIHIVVYQSKVFIQCLTKIFNLNLYHKSVFKYKSIQTYKAYYNQKYWLIYVINIYMKIQALKG